MGSVTVAALVLLSLFAGSAWAQSPPTAPTVAPKVSPIPAPPNASPPTGTPPTVAPTPVTTTPTPSATPASSPPAPAGPAPKLMKLSPSFQTAAAAPSLFLEARLIWFLQTRRYHTHTLFLIHSVIHNDADDSVRVIILTGSGRAFSSGVDLTAAQDVFKGDVKAMDSDLVYQMERCRKPIIGATNGFAVTAGFEISLACNILVAAKAAKFMDTHARLEFFLHGVFLKSCHALLE